MNIFDYVKHYSGNVVDWPADKHSQAKESSIYRIRITYEDSDDLRWVDRFADFLESPASLGLHDLVVGLWSTDFGGGTDEVIEALVNARKRLPDLSGLFFGDISSEESEISWIQQSDLSPIFNAYPKLEHVCIRGGSGLSFGKLRHKTLKSLIIQSGGLSGALVREVAAAQLPELEHLELWLGTPNYGGTASVEDLQPILDGERFPKLSYLGLRDSEIADDIAIAVGDAAILKRITNLDLSMGTLSDRGAEALLKSQLIPNLDYLDLHHNFFSDEFLEKLRALPMPVNLRDAQGPDEDWRYVSVGE